MKVLALSEGRALISARDGYFLVNRHDFYMGKALETYGEYGQAEAEFLQSLVSPGDTVIEVGANIGSHTVGLAKKIGRNGRLYAYEPQRACYALLQSQIALNELDHVIAIGEGCGAEPGTLWHEPRNYEKLGNFGSVSLVSEPQPGFLPVPVRRLDDVHMSDANKGERIRLLKVDVEGMESEVLLGARQLIATHQPLLYLENDRVANSRRLIGLVLDMGYRAWWHACPLFNPYNFFGQATNIYGEVLSLNMICMPAATPIPDKAFSGAVERDKPHPLEMGAPRPEG